MKKRRKSVAEKYALREIKRMHDTLMTFTKRINSIDNPSRMGLTQEQVRQLVAYIIRCLKNEECGSFRYLIYTVLAGVAYGDGMSMGLLDLNNALSPACDRRCKRRKYGGY